MTQLDKLELQDLKNTLLNLEITQPFIINQTLSDINLSLTFESIMLYRNLNELFLYINTHEILDHDHFIGFKRKILAQIDSSLHAKGNS